MSLRQAFCFDFVFDWTLIVPTPFCLHPADDGPYKWNSKIVDTLNAAGAKGTFFVNGNNCECTVLSSAVL